MECEYVHEPPAEDPAEDEGLFGEGAEQGAGAVDLTSPTPGGEHQQQTNGTTAQQTSRPTIPHPSANEILNQLKAFQAEHINQERLTLESSTVEVLAHSSCGNGDSYNNLPILTTEKDWPAFRDALKQAALKENTHDVLIGAKLEPQRPPPNVNTGLIDVDVWNEYIRQLAIYNRRNQLLLSALLQKTAPVFKNRIQVVNTATQAYLFLEDICAPRGSLTAFQTYNTLHTTTLASCNSNLQSYISTLESHWKSFRELKVNQGNTPVTSAKYPDAPAMIIAKNLPTSGGEVVSEEVMVFVFLRGLGDAWEGWVDGICRTSNVGGFGTGERLGWKEVCRRAVGALREGENGGAGPSVVRRRRGS